MTSFIRSTTTSVIRVFAMTILLRKVIVNAAYPSVLIWSDCGIEKCASLEFCKDGSNYGKSKTRRPLMARHIHIIMHCSSLVT